MAAGAAGVWAQQEEIRSLLDQSISRDFNTLDQGGKIIAEYVWIGGTGQDLRSKGRCAEDVGRAVVGGRVVSRSLRRIGPRLALHATPTPACPIARPQDAGRGPVLPLGEPLAKP